MPASAAKLEVVGAPFFQPSTNYTNCCLKRCPECGTYYLWDFEYEYLVNGSEDDLNLTRLNKAEEKEWIEKIDAAIQVRIKRYRAETQNQLDLLKTTNTIGALKKAVEYFNYAQNEGFDLGEFAPNLVSILMKHKHSKSEKCPGESLKRILLNTAKKNPQYNREIQDLLRNIDLNVRPPEVENLIKSLVNPSYFEET